MFSKYLLNINFLWILSVIGLTDSAYLTYEHGNNLAPCPTNGIIDCGKVIRGPYSEIFGIPVAAFGVLYYLSIFFALLLIRKFPKVRYLKYYVLISSTLAFLFSLYLVYLQLFVIRAICLYCMYSAITSTLIFILGMFIFPEDRIRLSLIKTSWLYKNIVKKILFLIDPEKIHENMLTLGEIMGKISFIKKFSSWLLVKEDNRLKQKYLGINFNYPVGLAAGFDYKAKLTQFLPDLGFGFMTVGTVTNLAYDGNPKPRLGRLPKSRSLMVNKGFKSEGAEKISEKLSKMNFEFPLGISIGRSNNKKLKTQKESIKDIIKSFQAFENAKVKNSFYELNISCPNLIHGDIEFYTPGKLEHLLKEVDKLRTKKPIFIKMPIEKSDKDVRKMLDVIVKHKIAGVIFGNLQKDRKDKSLIAEEVKKFKTGNFSGKPTFDRSNELIELSYKNYGGKLLIIGCGGIFSAEDAYKKVKLGATLVQMITGLIYQGPQLISEINIGLTDLMEKDGYSHISEAVGVDVS